MVNKYWKSFEFRVRNILRKLFHMPGIERVPLSGRLGTQHLPKGDIYHFPAFVEVKSTKNEKQITIKKEWLDKMIQQARGELKPPMLIFSFYKTREIYAIIPLREWMSSPLTEKPIVESHQEQGVYSGNLNREQYYFDQQEEKKE